jgi:CRISPR-associated endonuclease/helicase Cas3
MCIQIEGVVMNQAFISRKKEGATELIQDHLREVGAYSKICSNKFGVQTIGYLAGLLHDFGKYSQAFQDRIYNDIDNGAIHSQQGAKFVLEHEQADLLKEIIAQIIFAHHGSLLDGVDSDGELPMYDKLSKNEAKLDYESTKQRFQDEFSNFNFEELLMQAKDELLAFFQNLRQNSELEKEQNFYLHLLTKAVYSGLIDADRTCAYLFDMDKVRQFQEPTRDWQKLSEKLEEHLQNFSNVSQLNQMRQKISNQCLEKAPFETGIYQLNVPTGGGKTLSSLRFALNHAEQNKKDHIVYVVPYLSVLDQTANTIKEALDYQESDDYILEHHSNVLRPEGDEENSHYRLLTSSWDSPIILTTMVQFLETIYSNKGSNLRKLHNMANGILIFDEVQALPTKCTHLFNLAINFLNQIGNATILLCTATQPILDKVDRPIILSENPNLVDLSEEDLSVFKRTNIVDQTNSEYSVDALTELIRQQISESKSTLAIFNTKKPAQDVFEAVKKLDGCHPFFLSTGLCAAHRIDVLNQVKQSLNDENETTVLISTQLVEAGVDLSFECVIRAQAGLDSIVQAAGRCNRSGEFGGVKDVFVISMADENLSKLTEIKEGKEVCKRIFRENSGENFLSAPCLSQYYSYYFFNQEDKLDYRVNKTTLYQLLSTNYDHRKAYENIYKKEFRGLIPAFKEAANHFSVIDSNQTAVIVPYNLEAQELIDEFETSYDVTRNKRILEKLQKYSVSLYSFGLSKLEKEHAIRVIKDSIIVLDKAYYKADLGLVFSAELEGLFV